MVKYILFLLGLVIFSSCEKTDEYSGECGFPVEISETKFENGPFDGTMQIYQMNWTGTCLDITLAYSGGCDEHEFEVVTDGTILKTNPPIVTLAVVHDNKDLCEAFPSETINVDISYLEAYQDYDSIIIKLKNFEDQSILITK